ncbi:MAG: protein kinase [Gemmataceae bacterium]
MAGGIQSVPALLDALRQHQLLAAAQLDELARSRSGDARALARTILDRSLLTPFQVNLLLQGRGSELVLGSYVLLERLGEGATGQVFKAQHIHMRRLVALKLLRKEGHIDDETLERFRREMQLASQVTHPHVVQAYDAGLSEGCYFLVMEYIEGKDLGTLVTKHGPLALEQASTYLRQAAQGLQHVHDRGLVHRDIKPSNMLIAGQPRPGDWGQLKILDLGLARLQHAVHRDTAKLTATGALVMGTVDFMAPEQAMDFRKVDIRADIYSLGCTFYFALTGQVPFESVTVAEKLLRHQQAEPKPVERRRPDVTSQLATVLRKMMAKRPEDRYQQPAELVPLLGSMLPAVASTLPMAIPMRAAPTNVIDAEFTVRQRRPLGRSIWQAVRGLAGRLRACARFAFATRLRAAASACLLALLVAVVVLSRPARLMPSSPPVFLSDLQERTFLVDARCFSKNGVFGKERIMVLDSPSPKALYMFNGDGQQGKPVRVQYDLDKKYQFLAGAVAIDDSTVHGGSIVYFLIVGDGKELWKSEPFDSSRHKQNFRVNIADVKVLELMFVTSKWQWDRPLRGVWADPQLIP